MISSRRKLATQLLLAALFFTGLFSGVILYHLIATATTESPQQNRQTTPAVNYARVENPFATRSTKITDNANQPAEMSLTDKIHSLQQRLDELEQRFATLAEESQAVRVLAPGARNYRNKKPGEMATPIYTREQLIRGGIDETLASEIVRKQSETELARLELQDRARREGYFMTDRYEQELAQINAGATSLRDEIGEDEYDRFLYNSRLNNRVKVVSVMLGSAAEQAGIQKNDIILDYNGARMFSWNELKNATSEGQRDELVTISILRQGELFSLSIPRGPLGVRLGATRVNPDL